MKEEIVKSSTFDVLENKIEELLENARSKSENNLGNIESFIFTISIRFPKHRLGNSL